MAFFPLKESFDNINSNTGSFFFFCVCERNNSLRRASQCYALPHCSLSTVKLVARKSLHKLLLSHEQSGLE